MKKWGKDFMEGFFSIICIILGIGLLLYGSFRLFKWLKGKVDKQRMPKFTSADRELLELISDLAEIRRSSRC